MDQINFKPKINKKMTTNKKLAITIAFALFISIASFGQKKGLDTVVIKTMIYCDHCKKCESCVGRLEKEFYFEKGIKRVTLDDKAMTLTIVYDPKKTDATKLRQGVSKLGFDADDIKADPIALAKLDDCCKKQ